MIRKFCVFLGAVLVSCVCFAEGGPQTDSGKRGTPEYVAHRGLIDYRNPENTLVAFEAACKKTDVSGIEYDVCLTRDGHLVVTHDHKNISKVSNGTGAVYSHTLEELKKYNFGERHGMNVEIPTFQAVFDLCKASGKKQYIEIKDGAEFPWATRIREGKQAVDIIASEILKNYLENQCYIGSFTIRILQYVHERYPQIKTVLFIGKRNMYKYLSKGHLCTKGGSDAERCLQRVSVISVEGRRLTKEAVDEAHARGLKVNAWAVASKTDVVRVAEAGVDSITMESLATFLH